MRQERLTLYKIDLKYRRNLAKVDDRVMSISPQINKCMGPFVGIVIVCNDKRYCIPLSSPKNKHKDMKNSVDFMKIYDGDKLIGVLNFNNMIPVHPGSLRKVEIKILETDSQQNIAYKNLLSNQLSWCNSNRSTILKQAEKLYRLIAGGNAWDTLVNRCCNFVLDEKLCEAYARENFEP